MRINEELPNKRLEEMVATTYKEVPKISYTSVSFVDFIKNQSFQNCIALVRNTEFVLEKTESFLGVLCSLFVYRTYSQ